MTAQINLCFEVKQTGDSKIFHTVKAAGKGKKSTLAENYKMFYQHLEGAKDVAIFLVNSLNYLHEEKLKDNFAQFSKPVCSVFLTIEREDKTEKINLITNLKTHILLNCRGLGIAEKNKFLTFKENLYGLIVENLTILKDVDGTENIINSIAMKGIKNSPENVKDYGNDAKITIVKEHSKMLSNERKKLLLEVLKNTWAYEINGLNLMSNQIKRLQTKLDGGKLSAENRKKTTLKVSALTKARDEKRTSIGEIKQIAY